MNIVQTIIKNVEHLLNGTKLFPKWKKGTCIPFSEEKGNKKIQNENFFENIIIISVYHTVI